MIVEEKKNVVLLGHSSGGFTATASAIPELQAKTRKEKGEEGCVVGIFYMCAFLIPVGESVHSFFQPKGGAEAVIPPWCTFHVSSPLIFHPHLYFPVPLSSFLLIFSSRS